MDTAERTVMATLDDSTGVTRGMAATQKALALSLDLHAFHHFTHAAAVDGSCMEHADAHTPYRRQLAYGVSV